MIGTARESYALNRVDLLTLVDFRRPGSQHRLWVIERVKVPVCSASFGAPTTKYINVLIHAHVAHGENSGPPNGVPRHFSNTPETHMSCLGAFVTGNSIFKTNLGHLNQAPTLKLYGLDVAVNDNACRGRYIYLHGATYVTEHRGAVGCSHGCFATADQVNRKLLKIVIGGTFVYADVNPMVLPRLTDADCSGELQADHINRKIYNVLRTETVNP